MTTPTSDVSASNLASTSTMPGTTPAYPPLPPIKTEPPGPLSPQMPPQQLQPQTPRVDQADEKGLVDASSSPERNLDVNDALTYLDAVKTKFQNEPNVYNRFLDIMKDFKSGALNTPGVIDRVSELFAGHPSLIHGFNTFLPNGYRIQWTMDAQKNYITVTTPTGTTRQPIPNVPPPVPNPATEDPATFERANKFVAKVKERYADDPDTFKTFTGIMGTAEKTKGNPDPAIHQQLEDLFCNDPDLRLEVKEYFPLPPSPALQNDSWRPFGDAAERTRKREPAPAPLPPPPPVPPPKRRKRPAERSSAMQHVSGKSSSHKRTRYVGPGEDTSRHYDSHSSGWDSQHPFRQHHRSSNADPAAHPPNLPAPPIPDSMTSDDQQFFERVKRALSSREMYDEFLKLINLFTHDIIDTRTLLARAKPFLSRDHKLMAQLQGIVGWDDGRTGEAEMNDGAIPQPAISRTSFERSTLYGGAQDGGPSYRKLPQDAMTATCSGRDALCKEVLNDEWQSHPTWASEDAGFSSHRKNAYEEAILRTEEERHEYDFHIEALTRTIGVLEPISSKIAAMSPEDRASYKLKPNLSGQSKGVHQRIIKKIYGREAAQDVLTALQDQPAIAIPVVLGRLKQKEDEWKRAQREWNKVWREVDWRNYYRSLDHQGVSIKAADKRATNLRTMVNQIEAIREEHALLRASLVDPAFARTRPPYHLAYEIVDRAVLVDSLKLSLSFLDRTQGQVHANERRNIESFIRAFIPIFFNIDSEWLSATLGITHEDTGDVIMTSVDTDDEGGYVSAGGGSRSGRGRKRGGGVAAGDLRKRLLKSTQEKTNGRRTRSVTGTPTPASRARSPTPPDGGKSEVDEPNNKSARSSVAPPDLSSSSKPPISHQSADRYLMYSDTTTYAILRLLQMVYSRLLKYKQLGEELSSDPSVPYQDTSLANELALPPTAVLPATAKLVAETANPAASFYEHMLETCERLFDNEIDVSSFEETMRFMFGKEGYLMFTVDKLIGALLKQLQLAVADRKCQNLFKLFQKHRQIASPSVEEYRNYREQAEGFVSDSAFFKIGWQRDIGVMTFQLLNKDDGEKRDDIQVIQESWQQYVESYLSPNVNENYLRRSPYLKRHDKSTVDKPDKTLYSERSALEIRICMRTYKFFYVGGTGDIMIRRRVEDEQKQVETRMKRRKARSDEWIKNFESKGAIR